MQQLSNKMMRVNHSPEQNYNNGTLGAGKSPEQQEKERQIGVSKIVFND